MLATLGTGPPHDGAEPRRRHGAQSWMRQSAVFSTKARMPSAFRKSPPTPASRILRYCITLVAARVW